MYYIVNAETEQIVDTTGGDPPDVQWYANYFKCAVYVIRGEHTGLSAEPEKGERDEQLD